VHCITVVLSVAGRLPIVVFLRALKATESDAQRWPALTRKEEAVDRMLIATLLCVCVSPFGNSSRGWGDILPANISLVVYLHANEPIFVDKIVVDSRFCNTAVDIFNVDKT